MANPEHVEIVKQGTDAIGQWWKETYELKKSLSKVEQMVQEDTFHFDLSGADLDGLELGNARLSRANLRNATLRGTNLTAANFLQADLSDARLDGANLFLAYLYLATLVGADLQGASLNSTRFEETDCTSANFGMCRCNSTQFLGVDLSRALGLEYIQHIGPSFISIDTIFKSRGKVPDVFLRGCGVPDKLITNIPSLIGALRPIQFYSCFISYSHQDESFAQRLHASLQQKGLRVWYAPEDMKLGQKIHEQIESAIRVHDKLLLVLSEASMTSEWVKTEIAHARQREVKEGKRVLFPISLVPFDAIRAWKAFDADTGKDMAREIREYLVGDFSNWKDHDAFEKGFERLLLALRAEGAKESGAAP